VILSTIKIVLQVRVHDIVSVGEGLYSVIACSFVLFDDLCIKLGYIYIL